MESFAPGEVLYRLNGVSFSYGSVTALKELDLEFIAGESIVLLGANGTGKSTLLKLLNGLLFADSGSIAFMGRAISEESLTGGNNARFRSSVGLLFSNPDVMLFNATVFDEVAFGPLQLGLGTKEVGKRTEETLEMLGLIGLGHRAPHTLSSGEKKKVAIATVLAANPSVVLMDEPTLGLDPRTGTWFVELIHRLKEAGKTFILSTHDLDLAAEVADCAVVLSESHTLARFGKVQEVLADKELLIGVNIIGEPRGTAHDVNGKERRKNRAGANLLRTV